MFGFSVKEAQWAEWLAALKRANHPRRWTGAVDADGTRLRTGDIVTFLVACHPDIPTVSGAWRADHHDPDPDATLMVDVVEMVAGLLKLSNYASGCASVFTRYADVVVKAGDIYNNPEMLRAELVD